MLGSGGVADVVVAYQLIGPAVETLAQAGGPDADKLDEALAKAPEQVRALIGG